MIRFSLLLALLPHVAEAKCARAEQAPKVLTTRDTKLPDDGGILVGWANQMYDDSDDHPTGDPSDQPTWVAMDGKTKVALARTSLAPGLSVYKPAKFTGTLALQRPGKPSKDLGTFTRDAKAAANAMPAPVVTQDAVSTSNNSRWSSRQAIATLKSPPPPAAAALITYAVTAKGNVPIAFVTLPDTHDDLFSLGTFDDAGHCGSVVDGSRPPGAGDKVVFAWVDSFGRLSPVSAPIVAK